jgi:hypothetical protein
VHESRFARAVVADEPNTFSAVDDEIDTVERTDGAEMFFDAVQSYDNCACLRLHQPCLAGVNDEGCLRRAQSLLHVRGYRLDCVVLCVLVAGDTARLDGRQNGFKVVLGEGEIRHEQIVRRILLAVEDLLGDPEGE